MELHTLRKGRCLSPSLAFPSRRPITVAQQWSAQTADIDEIGLIYLVCKKKCLGESASEEGGPKRRLDCGDGVVIV